MAGPDEALAALADLLRSEDSVISPYVAVPAGRPTLGLLAASGPRARAAAGEYSLLVEAVREGYLLHYGSPRVVVGADPDLALLAGDYLYALGLRRLAALGDLAAVAELSDLISLCACAHAEAALPEAPRALWLASAVAVGWGTDEPHERAKASLRSGARSAAEELARGAVSAARRAGALEALGAAAESIDFPLPK